MIGDPTPPRPEIPYARVGVYACPTCGTELRFRGRCQDCKRSDKRRIQKPPKPSNRAKRRARLKARSDKELLRSAALKAIKLILNPFVTNCLRCNRPGSGFKSRKNPAGFEAHHPFRRRGYFFFLVVPLCETCHEEVEKHGDQARADRWLIKDPIKK